MKLLYITASTKPENMSISRQAGRTFLNRLLNTNPAYEIEELDLNSANIPEPNYKYYKGWVELVNGQEYDALCPEGKAAVDRMGQLCDQFLAADVYVIASPMWSMSFPSKLKQYLDCIMLNHKTIELSADKAKGLLCDKPRKMVYIQSSGGIYPKIIDWKFNYGVNYFHDLFKNLGIKEFYKILVQGTDMLNVGPQKAIQAAKEDFDDVLDKMCR